MTNVKTKPRDTLVLCGTAAARVNSVLPSVIEIEDVRAKTGVLKVVSLLRIQCEDLPSYFAVCDDERVIGSPLVGEFLQRSNSCAQ
jgi:hypothetical protein